MKMKLILGLLAVLFAAVFTSIAAEGPAKPKPYPLKTCVVSDEPLGGDHGEPYVFVHQGREIKLCCKPCQKDFNKEPAKYIKKIEAAEKKK